MCCLVLSLHEVVWYSVPLACYWLAHDYGTPMDHQNLMAITSLVVAQSLSATVPRRKDARTHTHTRNSVPGDPYLSNGFVRNTIFLIVSLLRSGPVPSRAPCFPRPSLSS